MFSSHSIREKYVPTFQCCQVNLTHADATDASDAEHSKMASSAWLKTVPPDGRKMILSLIKTKRTRWGENEGVRYSVRLSPTCGEAKNVDLIVRDPVNMRILREVPIMRKGKLTFTQ